MLDWSFPQLSRRPLAVWQRNARVWVKLFWPSLLGNVAEPMLYLLMLGYGLGRFVGEMEGLPYILFLASGFVCASVMNTASFESLYSAYTRMAVQNTWHGMLAAPLSVDDVVIGEVLWAATKAIFSSLMIVVVAVLLGVITSWQTLWAFPLLLLAGLTFSAMGLVVTALSRSYDFFIYYFTLLITPMFLFSGVFFPLTDLPPVIQWLPQILPLTHVVAMVRPLVVGAGWSADALLHLLVLLAYGFAALWLAIALIRRRLMS
jgi:lipooligosaccharide transport system permease protein